jgi:tetratricopeptide (TPR) repeat protein
MMDQLPLLAAFKVVPWYALTRFGKWDEMLAEPAPAERFLFPTGVWHYARGLAFLGKNQVEDAEKELAALKPIASNKALDFPLFSPNSAAAIMAVGPEVLAGEIAARKKDFDSAILHLERAVRLEDALVYTEPSEWHYPPRLSLGAVLLAAGRPREAEVVYWDDLKSHPDNGWALYGLAQSLRDQGKADAAAAAQARFEKAWALADVKLQASRF